MLGSKQKKVLFYVLILLSVFLFVEMGTRLFFRVMLNVRYPLQVIYKPNYINGFQSGITKYKRPGEFRVLCLGGSTSKQAKYPFNMQKMFQELLPDKKVTVYSAGWPAYTSRDAYYQYRYIYKGYDLDLIVFYEAINELRANSCPPHVFKSDYSHFGFYKYLNRLADDPLLRNSILCAMVKRVQIKLVHEYTSEVLPRNKKLLAKAKLIPSGTPIEEWLRYGDDIKSAPSHRENVKKVIELAQRRKQPILVMTFASYFPPYEGAPVAYGVETDIEEGGSRVPSPMRIYGLSENIRKGIAVHNAGMRELVAGYPGVYFIDQAKLMPAVPGNFIDVCHFSDRGIQVFMRNIYGYFRQKKAAGAFPLL